MAFFSDGQTLAAYHQGEGAGKGETVEEVSIQRYAAMLAHKTEGE
jgi:hypothetical protein